MFVVWMEKYQPDEPKRAWAAPGQPDLLGSSFWDESIWIPWKKAEKELETGNL